MTLISTKEKAKQLLDQAIAHANQGETVEAITIYNTVIGLDPQWAVPHFNLGLLYKYDCKWDKSYYHNTRATQLDETNEGAWWNRGIAATALSEWRVARQVWVRFGMSLEITDDEIAMHLSMVPIRLNPDDSPEVVWCKRIDPARAIIKNIPWGSSGHGYGDLVLNDGAPVGYRIKDGAELPVFNELQHLVRSEYSTYSTRVNTANEDSIILLEKLCDEAGVEMERWSSTVRMLCKQCSEGTPHEEHDQGITENTENIHVGFASTSIDAINEVLANWRTITLHDHEDLELELE